MRAGEPFRSPLLTAKVVSDLLDIRVPTVYRLADQGILPAVASQRAVNGATHVTQPSHKTLVILLSTSTTSRPDIGDEARRKERPPKPMCGTLGSAPQLSPLLSRNRVEIFLAKREQMREIGDNRKRGRSHKYARKYAVFPLNICFRLSFALGAFAGSKPIALSNRATGAYWKKTGTKRMWKCLQTQKSTTPGIILLLFLPSYGIRG